MKPERYAEYRKTEAYRASQVRYRTSDKCRATQRMRERRRRAENRIIKTLGKDVMRSLANGLTNSQVMKRYDISFETLSKIKRRSQEA